MRETYSSTSDPVFFFHHTMVDSIWEMWRQLRQTREQRESDYPPPFDDCYPSTHFANASLMVRRLEINHLVLFSIKNRFKFCCCSHLVGRTGSTQREYSTQISWDVEFKYKDAN
ncbi:hypothetical protein COOONC_19836 [Cooperia oncophora]